MTVPGRSGRSVFSLLFGLAAAVAGVPACYPSGGEGTAPPDKALNFPVGLGVSRGGNALYVVNSDFDLQWNGGTLQSYDLHLIREHTARLIADPTDPVVSPHFIGGVPEVACPGTSRDPGRGLTETCAPPVDSTFYVRDSAIIGAFATTLQLSRCPVVCDDTVDCAGNPVCESARAQCAEQKAACGPDAPRRIFVPVRGNASLTWAQVGDDDPSIAPDETNPGSFPPFRLDCGPRQNNRCSSAHEAGNRASEPGNTRGATMPGEPFGMAQGEDGQSIVITHQTAPQTSLLSSGYRGDSAPAPPAMQFVVDDLPTGGTGVAPIPYDRDAFPECADPNLSCARPRPGFLQTNRTSAQLDLLRYFSDEGVAGTSSLPRPFLVREAIIPLTVNSSGTDSRDVVIDPTPRLACKARIPMAGRTRAEIERDLVACARKPARVFIANRSPASLIVGEIGEETTEGPFDPDRITFTDSIPVALGVSRLYLAPIVNEQGSYELRLFIVSFDSAEIAVYNPTLREVENIIRVGTGPFAMAFDPFDLDAVARGDKVPEDGRYPPGGFTGPDGVTSGPVLTYRFAYVASFTNSYVQVIDLDNSRPDKSTYQRIVFTLGEPTAPKGS